MKHAAAICSLLTVIGLVGLLVLTWK